MIIDMYIQWTAWTSNYEDITCRAPNPKAYDNVRVLCQGKWKQAHKHKHVQAYKARQGEGTKELDIRKEDSGFL